MFFLRKSDNNGENSEIGEATPLLLNKRRILFEIPTFEWDFIKKIIIVIVKKIIIFYLFIFIILLSLISLILYVNKRNLSEGYKVSFEEIDVKNVTKDGLNIWITGFVEVDYSNIKPKIVRKVWKGFTGMMGNLNIYGLNFNIYLPDYSEKKVATVILSKIEIDIRDRHYTNFNEMTFSKFDNSMVLIESLKHFSQEKFYDIKISRDASFRLHFFHFLVFPVSIGRMTSIYNFPETSLDKVFDMNSLVIKDSSSDYLNAEIQLSTKIDFSISTYLPYLTWNVLVPSCDETKHIKIANIKSYFFYIKSSKRLNITLLSRIILPNNELIDVCNDTGISPLNRIVSQCFSKNYPYIYIIGDASETSMESYVPSWLFRTLTTTEIPIPLYGFPKINFIKSVKIDKFVVEDNKKGLTRSAFWSSPSFYGIVTVKIGFPGTFDFYINVTHICLNIELSNDGIPFSKISQNDWVSSTSLRPMPSVLLLKTKIYDKYFKILNTTAFNKILKEIILHRTNNFTFYIKGNISLKLDSRLGFLYFQNVPISTNVLIEY
ncbi:hypothetical protein T552_04164 [Pneumocystis carinii B80]|uniref:Uncharacterized protein n=1 Tax=Pneumocystis carinii (strain B80) TaxID=1408658 RepID=A0A0W4ZF64_PNEC8|nr:hypothetical protein T552_04164 [Pneumocystis carinii B80]KTW27031.1 hypothetical protein T552_04164 [Pneumocystis carinii B80]